jgi:hypothetical protein
MDFVWFLLGGACGVAMMAIMSINAYNAGYYDGQEDLDEKQ